MNKLIPTILAGVVGGLVVFGAIKLTEKSDSKTNVNTQPARQVYFGGNAAPFDFTAAAERSMSAVVHIKATESKQSALQRQRQNPLYQFFGSSGDFGVRSGTGSGVLYTSDGYILTNNHVVDFADEFEVTLHDNREFKARLVGKDENTDMAVIKIDATDLPAIELGNSDAVRVGEWALAVGNRLTWHRPSRRVSSVPRAATSISFKVRRPSRHLFRPMQPSIRAIRVAHWSMSTVA
jgi:serine protease Do